MMGQVRFWVVLRDKMVFVSGPLDSSLAHFYEGLRNDVNAAPYIPPNVFYCDCEFYRLENPVSVITDQFEDEGEDEQQDALPDTIKQACLEKTNRVSVNPRTTEIRQLAEKLSSNHIHLVIDIPDAFEESNKAVRMLTRNHATLFKCLQLTVESLGDWDPDDVRRNLRGGILTDNDNGLPPEFREIQQSLAKKRVYQAADEQKRDFWDARSYETNFNRIFAPPETGSRTVISDREFATFYNVLRCYHEDVPMIKHRETPPGIKTSNFTIHFIQPPFFSEDDSSRNFEYHQEKLKSWSFPIFVRTQQSVWRKFTPGSDWAVIARDHKIPFVISEMMSERPVSDRSRMLVQAIALARVGRYLLQSTSKRTFFVVAIYVDANMLASRYIVMQTGRNNTEHPNGLYHDKAVCIHRKKFDLTNDAEEVDFLCEMYNLATEATALCDDLDQLKKNSLKNIKSIARKVLSLTSRVGGTSMDSDTEGSESSDGWLPCEDGLGVFETEDIQHILHRMNYKIEFIPWGHPQLAVLLSKTGNKRRYLKFVERENEISVLRYLTEIESPSNHTISDVRFWPVQGGTVVSMPLAGGWLTALDHPNEELWSVALQLFEAVAFMHEHGVAHMDLKPQNVIIPAEGGRLCIIDFSVSIRVRGPDVKYTGIIGTTDYVAPEVRRGKYKPILADLWSCGRTLEELCFCCASSTDRTTLLEIAEQLMDPDAEARPKMSTVLEWMASAHQGKDTVASPALG